MTRVRGLNIDEAVAEAIKRDTLLAAQVYMCVWETERIVEQARRSPTWDTCFARILHDVTKAWNDRAAQETRSEEPSGPRTFESSGLTAALGRLTCRHCHLSVDEHGEGLLCPTANRLPSL